jgi:pimeloyl-ACP methyl ester carboxylesterase
MTSTAVGRVVSRDGTPIAYDRLGRGQPLILVDGALCSRALGPMPKLARLLASDFTVFHYDRRGRGDSGDTKRYAVDREIEDLEAVIKEAGAPALVFGISSGAVLALTAAARGLPIARLALYEAPLIVDDRRAPVAWAPINEAVAAGRRADALKLFLKAMGAPPIAIAVMRLLPVWSKIAAVAHTLPHDGAIVQDYQRGEPLPAGRWASVTIPTLAVAGTKSPEWMRCGMRSLADVVPNAQYRTLPGQTHNLAAKAIAPLLREFFAGEPGAIRQGSAAPAGVR